MFIDMHVHPAFYEPINQDSELEELRHNTLDIHKRNGCHWNIFLTNEMCRLGLFMLTSRRLSYTARWKSAGKQ